MAHLDGLNSNNPPPPPPEEEGGSMHRSVVDIPVFQYESRKGWTYT
jgi:hypothetical protein